MMDLDLSLQIFLQSNLSFGQIRKYFREIWSDLNIQWREFQDYGQTQANWIHLERNSFFSPNNSVDDIENDSINIEIYPFVLTLIFRGEITEVSLNNQVYFVNNLVIKLKSIGCIVKLGGDPRFEVLIRG